MDIRSSGEDLEAIVPEANNHINLLQVAVGCAAELLEAVRHVYKEERTFRKHEPLLWVGLIATLDPV